MKIGSSAHWLLLKEKNGLILRKNQVNIGFTAQPMTVVSPGFWVMFLLTIIHLLAPWEMTEISPKVTVLLLATLASEREAISLVYRATARIYCCISQS